MSLRIVAGRYGGRRISAPSGHDTRPTAERVREAWFSALGDRVRGASVMDLFAGSGALGLEAASRGAARVVCVERDRAAARTIEANVESLDLGDRVEVVRADVFRWLQEAERTDLALADPPYGPLAARLVARFRDLPFAERLCVEHSRRDSLDVEPDWTRRYGDTRLSFFDRSSHIREGRS